MNFTLLHNVYFKDDNNDGCSKRFELKWIFFHLEKYLRCITSVCYALECIILRNFFVGNKIKW